MQNDSTIVGKGILKTLEVEGRGKSNFPDGSSSMYQLANQESTIWIYNGVFALKQTL